VAFARPWPLLRCAIGAVLHEIRNLSAAAALMYANLAHTEGTHLAELQKNADFEALGSLLKSSGQSRCG